MGVDERYAANLYRRVFIAGSTPFERLAALYTGAIRLGRQGRTAALNGEPELARQRAEKVSAVLRRLDMALDHSLVPELSGNLSRLYRHMQGRLADEDTPLDPAAFDEVLALLDTLWEGFQEAEGLTDE